MVLQFRLRIIIVDRSWLQWSRACWLVWIALIKTVGIPTERTAQSVRVIFDTLPVSGHGTQKLMCHLFKGGIAFRCSAQDAEPMPMRNAAADLTRDARSLRRVAAPGDPW